MFDICISWLIVPLPRKYGWNVKMQYWLNEVLIIGYNYHIKPGLLVIKKDNSIVLVDDCSMVKECTISMILSGSN